ncbi:MAG: hypothetical protein FWB88_04495 [Defluviitaleaceae bacterium]|nr:hypothetical protein [Defluviitaleaceae bacterium]MCL2239673.1 hypothetical protein [Defluviitaleaceae bacterium]
MNIIRTKVVELSIIPAVAYRLKLRTGGSGIKLHFTDQDATAFAEVDKRTGEVVLDPLSEAAPLLREGFEEAQELLAGLPYSARGKVKITVSNECDAEEITEEEAQKVTAACMVASDEFGAIIDRFSDESGKINYALMNKQFIQFASSSSVVRDMCAKKAKSNEILLFVLKNRAAFLANKREHLPDEEATALLEALNEMNPRSAFKELSLHLRKMLSR